MGLFSATDIENAADNPFSLNIGRQVVRITKSEFDEIEIKNGDRAGETVDVWNVTVVNQKDDTEQKITFWGGGDESQAARTKSNIKKMLTALEIPTSEWAVIVEEHPEKLEGLDVTVEAKLSKKENVYIVFVGLPLPESAPTASVGNDAVPASAGAGW